MYYGNAFQERNAVNSLLDISDENIGTTQDHFFRKTIKKTQPQSKSQSCQTKLSQQFINPENILPTPIQRSTNVIRQQPRTIFDSYQLRKRAAQSLNDLYSKQNGNVLQQITRVLQVKQASPVLRYVKKHSPAPMKPLWQQNHSMNLNGEYLKSMIQRQLKSLESKKFRVRATSQLNDEPIHHSSLKSTLNLSNNPSFSHNISPHRKGMLKPIVQGPEQFVYIKRLFDVSKQ